MNARHVRSRTTARQRQARRLRKVVASLVAPTLALSGLAAAGLVVAAPPAEADETPLTGSAASAAAQSGAARGIAPVHQGADPASLHEIPGWDDGESYYLQSSAPGRVWTDKSVFAFEEITYNGAEEHGGITVPIGENELAVALSALASTRHIDSVVQVPIDVVMVLDISTSMSQCVGSTDYCTGTATASSGRYTDSRAYALAEGVNAALRIIHEDNPDNRVGIVTFGNDASVMMQLAEPQPISGTTDTYARLNRVGSDNMTLQVGGVQGTVRIGSSATANVQSTNTQRGIAQGMALLTAQTAAVRQNAPGGALRLPNVILFSDGEPTYSSNETNWWGPTCTTAACRQGPSSPGANQYYGNGFLAALTAAHQKNQVAEVYKSDDPDFPVTPKVYSVGLGIDGLNTRITGSNPPATNGDLARITLDPKTYLGDTSNAMSAGFTAAFETYRTGASVRIPVNGSNGNPSTYYTVNHPTGAAAAFDPAGERGIVYNDAAYWPASEQDMIAIFTQIAQQMVDAAPNFPIHKEDASATADGYVTFVDELGPFMEVTDVSRLVFCLLDPSDPNPKTENCEKHTPENPSIFGYPTKTTDGLTDTYVFTGQVQANPLSPKANVGEVKITVERSASLAQGDTVTVKVPVALIPIRNTDITEDEDGNPVDMTVTPAHPVHLSYKVAPKAGVLENLATPEALNTATSDDGDLLAQYIAANQDEKGHIRFYSNDFDRDAVDFKFGRPIGPDVEYVNGGEVPARPVAAKNVAKAKASFTPAYENKFYNFGEDEKLWLDSALTELLMFEDYSDEEFDTTTTIWYAEESYKVKNADSDTPEYEKIIEPRRTTKARLQEAYSNHPDRDGVFADGDGQAVAPLGMADYNPDLYTNLDHVKCHGNAWQDLDRVPAEFINNDQLDTRVSPPKCAESAGHNYTQTDAMARRTTHDNHLVTQYLGNVGFLDYEAPGALRIEKKVEVPAGLSPDANTGFPVQVTLDFDLPEGAVVPAGGFPYSLYDADAASTTPIPCDGGTATTCRIDHYSGTITLRAGQFALIGGLPDGTTYTAVESDMPGGWTQTSPADNSGFTGKIELPQDDVPELVFVNAYSVDPVSATPAVSKTLTGRDCAEDETFTMALKQAGTTVATVDVPCGESVQFRPVEFTAPGTYAYEIVEVAGSTPGITYSTDVYRWVVDVRDDGAGALVIASSQVSDAEGRSLDVAAFENGYTPESIPKSLTATKVMTDSSRPGSNHAPAGSFAFTFAYEGASAGFTGEPPLFVVTDDVPAVECPDVEPEPECEGGDCPDAGEVGGLVGDDQPADDEPADDEPADDEPADDEPADDEPGDDEDGDDQPAADEPADDEPADDEPGDECVPQEAQTVERFAYSVVESNVADTSVVSTPPLRINPEHAGHTFTYKASENELPTYSGVTNSTAQFRYTVSVTKDAASGDLSATVSTCRIDVGGCTAVDDAVFVNDYQAGDGEAVLGGSKDLTGRDWLDGETFTFALAPHGEETEAAAATGVVTMPESLTATATKAAPDFAFDAITFREQGTYLFAITEVPPAPAERAYGMTYDQHTLYYKVVVTDADLADGVLDVTVTEIDSAGVPTTGTAVFTNRVTPDPLGVSASLSGTYPVVYDWRLDKSVDDSGPVGVIPGENAEFTYTLEVTADRRTGEATASGSVVITNPNPFRVAGPWTYEVSVDVGQITSGQTFTWLEVPAYGSASALFTWKGNAGDQPVVSVYEVRPGDDPDEYVGGGVGSVVVGSVTDRYMRLWDTFPELAENGLLLDAANMPEGGWTFTYTAERGSDLGAGDSASYPNTAWVCDPEDPDCEPPVTCDPEDQDCEPVVCDEDDPACVPVCAADDPDCQTPPPPVCPDDPDDPRVDCETVEVYTGQDLSVVKTAAGSLTRVYDWELVKNLADGEVSTKVADANGKATFDYEVTVTPKGYEDSGWAMSGTATVTNPNAWDVPLTRIEDTISLDEVACEFDPYGESVTYDDEGRPLVPAASEDDGVVTPGSIDVGYTCTFSDDFTEPEAYEGTNTVTVTWDRSVALSENDSAEADYEITAEHWIWTYGNKTITVWDDKTDPTNPVLLGTATWNADGERTTFRYTLEVDGPTPPATAVEHDNWAWIAELCPEDAHGDPEALADCKKDGYADDETVKVTRVGKDLTVVKTAAGTLTELYNWTLAKELADGESGVKEAGPDGTATFDYVVSVRPEPFDTSDWLLTGTITVSNPNSWPVPLTRVTDAPAFQTGTGGLFAAYACTFDPYGASVEYDGADNPFVPANGTIDVGYRCTFADKPALNGVNTVSIEWDAQWAATGDSTTASHTRPVSESDWTKTPADPIVTVVDDKTDPANPVVLGQADLRDPGTWTFTYGVTVDGPADESASVDHVNWAWISRCDADDPDCDQGEWACEPGDPDCDEPQPECTEDQTCDWERVTVFTTRHDLALRTWVAEVYRDLDAVVAGEPVIDRTGEADLIARPGPVYPVPHTAFDQDEDVRPGDVVAKDVMVVNQGNVTAKVTELRYAMAPGLRLATDPALVASMCPWQPVDGGGLTADGLTGDSAVLYPADDCQIVLEPGEHTVLRLWLRLEDNAWFLANRTWEESTGKAVTGGWDRSTLIGSAYGPGGDLYVEEFDTLMREIEELDSKVGQVHVSLDGYAEIAAFDGWVPRVENAEESGEVEVAASEPVPASGIMAAGASAVLASRYAANGTDSPAVVDFDGVDGVWAGDVGREVSDVDSTPGDADHVAGNVLDNALDTDPNSNGVKRCTYDQAGIDEDDHDGENLRVVIDLPAPCAVEWSIDKQVDGADRKVMDEDRLSTFDYLVTVAPQLTPQDDGAACDLARTAAGTDGGDTPRTITVYDQLYDGVDRTADPIGEPRFLGNATLDDDGVVACQADTAGGIRLAEADGASCTFGYTSPLLSGPLYTATVEEYYNRAWIEETGQEDDAIVGITDTPIYDAALRTWVESVYRQVDGEWVEIYESHSDDDDPGPDYYVPYATHDDDGVDVQVGDVLVYAIRLFNQGTEVVRIDEITFTTAPGLILVGKDITTATKQEHNDGWVQISNNQLAYYADEDPDRDHTVLMAGDEMELHLTRRLTPDALESAEADEGFVRGFAEISQIQGLACAEAPCRAPMPLGSAPAVSGGGGLARAAMPGAVGDDLVFSAWETDGWVWTDINDVDSTPDRLNGAIDQDGNLDHTLYWDNEIHGTAELYDPSVHIQGVNQMNDEDDHDGVQVRFYRGEDTTASRSGTRTPLVSSSPLLVTGSLPAVLARTGVGVTLTVLLALTLAGAGVGMRRWSTTRGRGVSR